MAKATHKSPLKRMLGKKIVFQGKFDRGDNLQAMAEAQQALIAEDLDASVDYLVLADASAGKTIQKKALSLNAKGATIQVLDAAAFKPMVEPTPDEILALLRGGKECAPTMLKAIGFRQPHHMYSQITYRPNYTITAEKFDGLDLSDFYLQSILFEQCSFVGATLNNAHFGSAQQCDFRRTTGTEPVFADVEGCRFTEATLKGAKFQGNVANADFSAADLEKAEFHWLFYNRSTASLTAEAGCVFARANLRSAAFSNMRLKSPDFDNADMTGATFNVCKLDSASFRNATLRDASLVACTSTSANMSGADLRGANLGDADLTDTRFDGADLAGCNLRGTKLGHADLSKAKNYDPSAASVGTVGPALTEMDTLVSSARRIEVTFRLKTDANDEGEEVGIDSRGLKYGWGIRVPVIVSRQQRTNTNRTFSDAMLLMANLMGNREVRFETVEVSSTKAAKGGRELRELAISAISEAFAQPVPPADELAAATKAWREQVHEQGAVDRERREAAKKLAEKEKITEKKKIAKKIAKEVGQVTDIATFLKALELRADKQKIDKATKMLKASGFQLFNDVTDTHLNGVVKSQTDPDLVYACRIEPSGAYACCTQNLNICGGLRGSICKHLLVLIIGLVKAGELDPTTIDTWVAKTHDAKPELNKETMGEIFIRYKGAEAGEVDWRPTETVPEDYYAL